jgi:anti-sigma factor RsiW
MNARLACVDGIDLLMDYLEGALPDDVRKALDGHLAGCSRCVAFVKSYRETPRILRAATVAAMPAAVQESLR